MVQGRAEGGGEKTEPGDPQDMEAAGSMTNPREGESVLTQTLVDDEHSQGVDRVTGDNAFQFRQLKTTKQQTPCFP